MRYEAFFAGIHRQLAPERYLEIGVRDGHSLTLARCRTVAIDPDFAITHEIDADVALFRTTSDEYFSRPDPLAPTGGKPFDLAFIDGLHLFEFALRDFINAEKYSTPGSMIVFDDVLPRSVAEAARARQTGNWTGDVFKILAVLAEYRPDLRVLTVSTRPTGLLLVVGLDPTSTVLADNYGEITRRFIDPDPQPVPAELLDRRGALPAARVLESGFWKILVDGRRGATADQLRPVLRAELGATLGPVFA